MPTTTLKFRSWLTTAAALLLFASCSSPPANGPIVTSDTPPGSDNSGFGGKTVETSSATNATVVSLDAAGKKLKLKLPDGSTATYDADPAAIQLKSVKPGDPVKILSAERRSVGLRQDAVLGMAGPTAPTIEVPPGVSPLARKVATQSFLGTLTAIDRWNNAVTLKSASGEIKTIKVKADMSIGDVNVGDAVAIRVSQATLILPDKP